MLFLLLLAALTAPPAAATDAPQASPAKVAAKPLTVVKDRDAITCKYENPTGRRIATRICRTNQEWDELERQSKEVLRASGSSNRCQGISSPSCPSLGPP